MIEYFEKRAPSYRAKSARGLWSHVRKQEFSAVVNLLAPSSGERILDFGCGAGHYAYGLKHEFGADVLAVDSSPAMVREVSLRGIPAWLGPAEDFPETGRGFDKILAAGMMEFVADPRAVFAKCARLLGPGGKFVLLIPTAGWRGFFYRAAHEWNGCAVFIRSREEYTRLAAEFGFELHAHVPCTPISAALEFRRRP